MANCPNCNGAIKLEGPPSAPIISTTIKPCPTCGGSGEVSPEIPRQWDIYNECRGWGSVGMMIAPLTCPAYRGGGMVSRGRGRVI